MLSIVTFKPEHLAALRLQPWQAAAQHSMNEAHGRELAAQTGLAYTALDDGVPLACAGVIEIWRGRAYAWSYLSAGAFKQFKAVHRAVLEFLVLAAERWPRIEMAIDVDHVAAKRWAFHLGFALEGVARKWTPEGRDAEIWARVT